MADFFGDEGIASHRRTMVEFKAQVSIGVGRAAYRDARVGSRWPATATIQGPDHRTQTRIKRASGNIHDFLPFNVSALVLLFLPYSQR